MRKIRKDTAGIKKTQVNRKLHYKKMAALAVAGVLVAGTALTEEYRLQCRRWIRKWRKRRQWKSSG